MGMEASKGQDEGLRAQGRVGIHPGPFTEGTQDAVERAGGDEEATMWTGGGQGPEASAPEPRQPGLLPAQTGATDQTRHQQWLDMGRGGAQEQGPVNPGQLKCQCFGPDRHRVHGAVFTPGPQLEPVWALSCRHH